MLCCANENGEGERTKEDFLWTVVRRRHAAGDRDGLDCPLPRINLTCNAPGFGLPGLGLMNTEISASKMTIPRVNAIQNNSHTRASINRFSINRFSMRPILPSPQTSEQSRRDQQDRYHNSGGINGRKNGPRCICLHNNPKFRNEAALISAQIRGF